MSATEILKARLAEKLATEGGPSEPASRPKRVERNSDEPDVFALARTVDTVSVLDRLGVAHDDKFATCPGCGEEGAKLCENGGIKCLHDRCAGAGPKGHPGFRSTIDLVMEAEHLEKVEAAKRICEWGGIVVPERKKKDESNGDPPEGRFDGEWTESAEQPIRNDGTASVSAAVEWHDARSIFAPLAPTNWLVPELQICPGRPTLWCGYGYVGKSITAQSKAAAMAGGMPVFGKFDIRRGVVRHFDHEQGKHATFKRYQRIAVGMELEPGEFDGRLFVTVFPSVYLNLPNAVDVYCRLCEGTDFAIIDALRGATPGEDENDSKIRVCLDNLGRVSEKTGTIFEVLHHSGKPQEGHTDQRTKARGSSAIFDACGPVFILSGSKESPHKLVSQQKAPAEAEGGAVDDFYLTVEDVTRGFNPRAGVRVTYRSTEEIAAARPTESEVTTANDDRVLALIRDNPGSNARQLRVLARPMRNADVDDAVTRLLMTNKVETKPASNRQILHYQRVET
jgi:hypothetical protein